MCFSNSGRLSSARREAGPFFLSFAQADREVFPPEPPVAQYRGRNGAEPSRAPFGAAKRTLDGEHRSGIHRSFDGRRSGNTFLLVSPERLFGQQGR